MTIRLAIVAALLAAGCKSREPTPPGERPTIESLDPPRECFPTGQPDNRDRPSAGTLPTSAPATQSSN